MRRVRALVALAVLPVLVVACSGDDNDADTTGGGSDGTAIQVDSTKISAERVLEELRTIAGNERLVRFFRSQDANLVPREGTINADTAANWVNSVANQIIVDRELKRRNLTTAGVDKQKARDAVTHLFGGRESFAAFPEAFQDRLLRAQERIDALRASFPPNPPPTEAQLQEVLARLQQECPGGKLLSQIWRRDKAEVEAIAAELAQGADFATLARDRSEETNSGARGGLLTCIGTPGYRAYPAKYRTAAEAVPMGGVSGPVAALGGHFLLRVTPLTLENAIPLLESQFRSAQEDPFAAFLLAEAKAAKPFKISKQFATVIKTPTSFAIVPNPKPVQLTG